MLNLFLYIIAFCIFAYLIYESYTEGGWQEAIKFTFIFSILFFGIRYFLIQPFLVDGPSMSPTFETGNYLLVEKVSYFLDNPKRGDVVVFDEPQKGLELGGHKKTCYIPDLLNMNNGKCIWDSKRYLVKRLVGLPGEKIVVLNGTTTIYNKENPNGKLLNEKYVEYNKDVSMEIELGKDEYFVMGDNRANSLDSRYFGPVEKNLIVGRPALRLIPLADIYPGDFRDYFNNRLFD